jgi:hypothetical protein
MVSTLCEAGAVPSADAAGCGLELELVCCANAETASTADKSSVTNMLFFTSTSREPRPCERCWSASQLAPLNGQRPDLLFDFEIRLHRIIHPPRQSTRSERICASPLKLPVRTCHASSVLGVQVSEPNEGRGVNFSHSLVSLSRLSFQQPRMGLPNLKHPGSASGCPRSVAISRYIVKRTVPRQRFLREPSNKPVFKTIKNARLSRPPQKRCVGGSCRCQH